MKKILIYLLLLSLFSGCNTSQKVILTKDAPLPIGPYNQALLISNTLYISGQIGLNPENSQLIPGGIEEEFRQAMNNMDAILKAAGMSFKNIVKISIFIKNMSDFEKVNIIYKDFFSEPYPARETIGINELPKKALIEISGIAVK
jgi:2-iminobutanoate/2-iminopropanoate deaminase